MLQPMRTKFRKAHKGRIHGLATSAVDLAFGQYGLKAVEPERITARQIEEVRRDIARLKTIAVSKRQGSGTAKAGADKPAAAKRTTKRAKSAAKTAVKTAAKS